MTDIHHFSVWMPQNLSSCLLFQCVTKKTIFHMSYDAEKEEPGNEKEERRHQKSTSTKSQGIESPGKKGSRRMARACLPWAWSTWTLLRRPDFHSPPAAGSPESAVQFILHAIFKEKSISWKQPNVDWWKYYIKSSVY